MQGSEIARGAFIELGLLWAKWDTLSITNSSDGADNAKACSLVAEEVKACLFINDLSREIGRLICRWQKFSPRHHCRCCHALQITCKWFR